jgi:thiol:disulfide interchange protein
MTRLAIFMVACSHAAAPQWAADERVAFDRARAEHKGVMVELYAAWSVPCEEMDRALRREHVAAALHDFVPVKLDVSDGSDAVEALRARYHSQALPEVVFVATDGKVIGRISRVVDEPELVGIVERATAELHGGTMHP